MMRTLRIRVPGLVPAAERVSPAREVLNRALRLQMDTFITTVCIGLQAAFEAGEKRFRTGSFARRREVVNLVRIKIVTQIRPTGIAGFRELPLRAQIVAAAWTDRETMDRSSAVFVSPNAGSISFTLVSSV